MRGRVVPDSPLSGSFAEIGKECPGVPNQRRETPPSLPSDDQSGPIAAGSV